MKVHREVAVALVGALLLLPGPIRADEAHNCMKRGLAMHQRGKFKEALTEYRKAIEQDRNWGEPHRMIGLIYKAQGRLDEAIAEYRTALAKDKTSATAHNDLGVALRQKGALGEAMEHFQAALRIDPKMVEANYNTACLLYQQNKIEEAVEGLKTTLRLNPKYASAHHSMAVALGRLGRWPEAVKSAERAAHFDGDAPAHWLFLAWSNYQIGFTERAADFARRGIAKDPQRADGHYLLGFIETARRRLDGAVAAYERALQIDNKRALQRAVEDLRRELIPDGQAPEAYYALGLLLQAQEEPAEARAAYEAYLARVSSGKWAQKAREAIELLK